MKKLIRDGRKDTQTDYNNKLQDETTQCGTMSIQVAR